MAIASNDAAVKKNVFVLDPSAARGGRVARHESQLVFSSAEPKFRSDLSRRRSDLQHFAMADHDHLPRIPTVASSVPINSQSVLFFSSRSNNIASLSQESSSTSSGLLSPRQSVIDAPLRAHHSAHHSPRRPVVASASFNGVDVTPRAHHQSSPRRPIVASASFKGVEEMDESPPERDEVSRSREFESMPAAVVVSRHESLMLPSRAKASVSDFAHGENNLVLKVQQSQVVRRESLAGTRSTGRSLTQLGTVPITNSSSGLYESQDFSEIQASDILPQLVITPASPKLDESSTDEASTASSLEASKASSIAYQLKLLEQTPTRVNLARHESDIHIGQSRPKHVSAMARKHSQMVSGGARHLSIPEVEISSGNNKQQQQQQLIRVISRDEPPGEEQDSDAEQRMQRNNDDEDGDNDDKNIHNDEEMANSKKTRFSEKNAEQILHKMQEQYFPDKIISGEQNNGGVVSRNRTDEATGSGEQAAKFDVGPKYKSGNGVVFSNDTEIVYIGSSSRPSARNDLFGFVSRHDEISGGSGEAPLVRPEIKVRNFMTISLVSMIFCNVFIGAAAVFLSWRTNVLFKRNKIEKARVNSRRAFYVNMAALVVGICTYIGFFCWLGYYLFAVLSKSVN